MPHRPSQEIGADNASKLRAWIEQTPLKDVPRNYSGRSSKLAICRALKIYPSTIGTNNAIKEMFEKLDLKLAQPVPKSNELQRESSPPTPSLPLAELLAENDELRAALARLRHLGSF